MTHALAEHSLKNNTAGWCMSLTSAAFTKALLMFWGPEYLIANTVLLLYGIEDNHLHAELIKCIRNSFAFTPRELKRITGWISDNASAIRCFIPATAILSVF